MWRLITALLFLAAPLAHADTAILLHGHLGSQMDFRDSGFTDTFARAGWRDGGHFSDQRTATIPGERGAARIFCTVALTGEAPLREQARQLGKAITQLRARRPHDPLVLIGFSAGGVVARLYMVEHPREDIRTLVTLASPHLGTESAALGRLIEDSGLGAYAEELGAGFIRRSQALYEDLLPEQPGSFLHALNRQAHPRARYISIVRINGEPEPGDLVVPAASQDLNNVHALRDRAETLHRPGVHGVTADDGELIVRLLAAGAST
jgi:pimeloyl-ACP methyl ester carboxylesterase